MKRNTQGKLSKLPWLHVTPSERILCPKCGEIYLKRLADLKVKGKCYMCILKKKREKMSA